jgi:hypothetical protein
LQISLSVLRWLSRFWENGKFRRFQQAVVGFHSLSLGDLIKVIWEAARVWEAAFGPP